jgi:hypothetical protein
MMYPTQIGETCLIILLGQLLNVTHVLHRRSAKDVTLRVSQTRGFNQPERAVGKGDGRKISEADAPSSLRKELAYAERLLPLKLHTTCRIP